MFREISNCCPRISRTSLTKNSMSFEFIWQTIWQHFGFQVTSTHFIDFSDIHFEPNKCPEDLYQQLMEFVLSRTNGLTHHSIGLLEDKELSPTLENFVVLIWLKLIHPQLPRLINHGMELWSHTLASIKPVRDFTSSCTTIRWDPYDDMMVQMMTRSYVRQYILSTTKVL